MSGTIGEQAHGTLRQLQDLLAHQIPDGDPAAIVELALEALLEQTLKKKAALTRRPRAQAAGARSNGRTIPAPIRCAVWKRDGGRCAFIGQDGRRCNETRALEYAHDQPWAKGGAHSVDNIGLRCRAHDAYEANRDYGQAFMAKKRRRPDVVRERRAPYVRASAPAPTRFETCARVIRFTGDWAALAEQQRSRAPAYCRAPIRSGHHQ